MAHAGGARRGGAGPRGPRAREDEDASAAARGGRGGRRPGAAGDRGPGAAAQGRAQREVGALRVGGGRARALRAEAELPHARPALRQADAAGGGRHRRARPGQASRRRSRRDQLQRPGARDRPGRRDRRPPAARRLPGGALGHARGGAEPRARRRPPPRGPGARGGARRAGRSQERRTRRGGPHRAEPRRRRGPPRRRPRARGLRDGRDARDLARVRRRAQDEAESAEIDGRRLSISVTLAA